MTKRDAMRITGLKATDFTGLRMESSGINVNTWGVTLTKTLALWGRRGSRVLFPAPNNTHVRQDE